MDYKDRLLNRKNEIEQVIRQKQEYLGQSMSESMDELSSYDQHPADLASEVFEREKNLGILEMLEFELEKVDDALNKYASGQYGICEACGQSIEPARLERLVNTTLCASCARGHQKKFTPSVEENIVNADQISDLGESFQVAGYELYE